MSLRSVSRRPRVSRDDSAEHRVSDSTAKGTIVGTIHESGTGVVIPNARIEVDGTPMSATSDANGQYAVPHVPQGTVSIRVTADGYAPFIVDVTTPANGEVRVDVTLARVAGTAPVLVAPRVTLLPLKILAPFASHTPPLRSIDAQGRWHWVDDPEALSLTSGEPDIFRALAGDPTIAMRPDWPPALQNRGGSGDQTAILVDGLPVWNPLHAGSVLSAIPPDAVAGMTMNDGAFSARYGDRLGGALDVTLRDVPRDAPIAGLAIGPQSSRAMWGTPLARTGTSEFLVTARRSNADVFGHNQSGNWASTDRWLDGLGMLRLANQDVSLTLLTLGSNDRLPPNRWGTRTTGAIWRQRLGGDSATTMFELRLWNAAFDAFAQQRPGNAVPTLTSNVRQNGAIATITTGGVTIGASADILRTRYIATRAASDTASEDHPPLHLQSAPIEYAAFTTYHIGTRRQVAEADVGLRAAAITSASTSMGAHIGPRVEPRITIAIHPSPVITTTAGYARTHQFVQSLRNDASLYGSVIGVDFPVVAGTGGVPVAWSDVGTAGIFVMPTPNVQWALMGYTRSLHDLVTVPVAQTGLFAVHGMSVADGHAAGLGTSLSGMHRRVTWQVLYDVGRTIMHANGIAYHPSSELGHTACVSVAVQADRLTQLRLAGWMATNHQLTQLGRVGNEWIVDDLEQGIEREEGVTGTTGGTSQPSDDSLETLGTGSGAGPGSLVSSAHVPTYLRIDLTITHMWHTGPGPGRLSGFLTVANLFDRKNVALYQPSSGTTAGTITLTPRSLLGGLSWRY